MDKLDEQVKRVAHQSGAHLVGIADAAHLPDQAPAIATLLPGASRLVVVATGHNRAALRSADNEARQFDTIHTYDEAARAAHAVARFLDAAGHAAIAVPAFIPLDMAPPKKGMRGAVDWRRAAYWAGLGSKGENGLLVTRDWGSAVRLCGVVTTAPLNPDGPLAEDVCDHCGDCRTACPPGALGAEGAIDKKKCGDHIFRYGFRAFQGLMAGLFDRQPSAKAAIEGVALRELWQNFMTGNYYYCFACQTQCHGGGRSSALSAPKG